jgi:2'-5' RNA ligase
VRLFLAINLEPRVRRAIVEATSALREVAPTLNWVDEMRLHLTLKFLGEQSEDVVTPLTHSVDRTAERHKQFTIRLGAAGASDVPEARGAIGAFPNFRRARVVWMAIDRDPKLEWLHHDIEVACEKLGFDLDGRAFRPHLTLARVREKTDAEELRRLARASKRLEFDDESTVESIDLMKSDLSAHAPRYERLHAAPLRSS